MKRKAIQVSISEYPEALWEFIKDADYELLDSSISFSKDGYVTWCGDLSTEPDSLRDFNFVISKVMKWRIVSP